ITKRDHDSCYEYVAFVLRFQSFTDNVLIHVAEPRIVFLAVELENAIPQLRCWPDVLTTLTGTTVLLFLRGFVTEKHGCTLLFL
ncbi:hypothetical protein Ancab_015073, partial [Ancistrocladus abbreviatus]